MGIALLQIIPPLDFLVEVEVVGLDLQWQRKIAKVEMTMLM